MSSDVTFATKCWQQDWHKFLGGIMNKPKYKFTDEVLYLNNGVPEAKFNSKTIRVEEHIPEVLDFFKLTPDSFTCGGYAGFWYSIAELTAIYFCKTEYLCWVQSDCLTEGEWIRPELIKDDTRVISPYSEVNTWGDDWHFSDQSFLIRTEEFRKPIYEKSILPDYPFYGGDSFEKMCGNYLKKNNLKRKIINEAFCHHD